MPCSTGASKSKVPSADGADGLNALTHLEGVYPAACSYLELGVVKLMLGRVDDSHRRG
jgi:hypothetical protein